MAALRALTATRLWRVAEQWADDAGVLSGANGSANAIYFAAGFAAECALKSTAMRHANLAVFPRRTDWPRFYSHDLRALANLAGLRDTLRELAGRGDPAAAVCHVVSRWEIGRRYDDGISRDEAQSMLRCVAAPESGILQWLQHRFRSIG